MVSRKHSTPIFWFSILILVFSLISPQSIMAKNYTPVGVYYYVWYDEGFGNRHWNDSIYNIVVDEPLYYSYYSSRNETYLEKQIDLMWDAGIDFVLISWWGNNSYEDNATQAFINVNANRGFPLKFAIFVEPYTQTPNYTFIYNYVFERYAQMSGYFKWRGKPLLCWFNPLTPPKNDMRFTDRVVGMNYVDWSYWNKEVKIETDGCTVVIPRYDDYYLYYYGARKSYMQYDVNYTEEMYDKQWKYVIKNAAKVKLVLICTWNEYHERTMIEPHNDISNPNNSYAYLKTVHYIDVFRNVVPPTCFTPMLLILAIPIISGILLAIIVYRKLKGRIKPEAQESKSSGFKVVKEKEASIST